MKIAKHILFILLSAFCFSQAVFACNVSNDFIQNINAEITHPQTIFDTEKEIHTFIVRSTNSELSQLSQRKKIDFNSFHPYTLRALFDINDYANNYNKLVYTPEILIKRLFLSEYSPHAP